MKFHANIVVMPQKALLDPQGRTVSANLKNLNLSEIDNVRIGKHITLELEAINNEQANQKVDQACKQLLANPIMETYEFTLVEQK